MAFYTYFEEHEDSPTEGGNRSGDLRFQRVFLTTWSTRWQFLSELYSSGPFGLPASYSTYWPGVLADEFTIDRILNAPEASSFNDPNIQQLTHDTLAKITVNYTPLDHNITEGEQDQLPSGTFATYSQTSNVEFLSIPSRAMKWESDDVLLPPDVQPVLPQPATTHVVTWHQVIDVPWVTISNMKGKVNATAFKLPGSVQTFAAETLMFEGLEDESTLSIQQQLPSRQLTLRFVEKAQHFLETSTDGGAGSGTVYGWNHQFRDDTQAYDKPVNADDDGDLFQTYEFNNLWLATS